jgi:hypothetical protein
MPENLGVIKLTIYGPDDEVKAEHRRGFVPWKLLKKAIRLSKSMGEINDLNDLSDETIDELAQFICDFFGNQFTVQDLDDGADVEEMMAVLQTVIGRAGALNPTKPG